MKEVRQPLHSTSIGYTELHDYRRVEMKTRCTKMKKKKEKKRKKSKPS